MEVLSHSTVCDPSPLRAARVVPLSGIDSLRETIADTGLPRTNIRPMMRIKRLNSESVRLVPHIRIEFTAA